VLSQGEPRDTVVNFDTYRILQYKSITERLCTRTRQPCRRGRIWRRSQHKTPWVTFRGDSRSRILESPKSRRGTTYYCI